MGLISFLILFPFLAALVMACMRKSGPVRKYTMFVFCVLIMAGTLIFAATSLMNGKTVSYLPQTHAINTVMLLVEWALMVLVIYQSFRHKKYYCALLSIAQTGLITWLELTGKSEFEYH